ncbi:LysR substrate-binding domain-containing protein [Litoribacillus peritrichatus]|uniref:LysR substrate-binding domain-containing protein n=2 Tax=Litoribacillus peritrichatus TaxID=718191 RepID=A0ABP7MRA5_9GAMM
MKSLEQHLGLFLFSRRQRELALTQAGQDFFRYAKGVMDLYESGYASFSEKHHSSKLIVSMIPFVANQLVIPSLEDLYAQFPDMDLVIETNMAIEDLASSELDAAVRFGIPPWQDCQAELIASAQLNLMASPEYLRQHPLSGARDWQHQTLIHIRSRVNDWQRFLMSNKLTVQPKKELYFDSYEAGMNAAEAGLGIVMGVFPISRQIVEDGRLVSILDQPYEMEEAFYLVTKPNLVKQANYRQLLNWLRNVFNKH